MSNWGTVRYNRARGHWAVVGTWQGQRCYFCRYESMLGPVTCETRDLAERLRAVINTDIERGVFNPARYRRARPLHVRTYAESWLETIRPDLAAATYRSYTKAVGLYLVPVLGDRFLPDLGHADLQLLMRAMQHLRPASRKTHMAAFHRLMICAHRDGHITQMPPWIEFRGSNEVNPPAIKYLRAEDQVRILGYIPVQHRPIFMFMMATGCRISEARALRKQDIREDYVVFESAFGYDRKLKSVKSKRSMTFPITPEVREILDSAPRHFAEWVFINPSTGRPYTMHLRGIWSKACDDAGVQRISLYQAVRHSFACQLLNSGVDKATVSRLLRHSSLGMIERYAIYEVAALERAAGTVRRFAANTLQTDKQATK